MTSYTPPRPPKTTDEKERRLSYLAYGASLAAFGGLGGLMVNADVLTFDPGPDQSQPGFRLAEAVVPSTGRIEGLFWHFYHQQQDPWARLCARARQLAEELPEAKRERVLAYVDTVIEEAQYLHFTPDRVARDPEGGVVFYFWGTETLAGGAHRKYALFECSAEDGMFVTMDDRLQGMPSVWEVTGEEEDIRASLDRIRTFIT